VWTFETAKGCFRKTLQIEDEDEDEDEEDSEDPALG
jgi:hypothetical protein